MNLAMCEVPVHPVEHIPDSVLASLPELPMTQSSDGTWYCDGESTQTVQEQGKNIMDCTKATSIVLDKGEGYIRTRGWATNIFNNAWVMKNLKPSTTYYGKMTITMNENVTDKVIANYQKMMGLWRAASGELESFFVSMFGNADTYLENGESTEISSSFTTPDDLTNLTVLVYTDRYTDEDGTGNYNSDVTFSNIMLSEVDAPYEHYQPAMPSPDYPSPITNTYPAGTYKAVCGDKVYKVVLDDDLRSVPTYADRATIDVGRGKLKIEKGIGYIESYTDESVETVYMSSTGELTEGATVIYQLATPTTHQFIPTQLVTISTGQSAQILNTVNDKADYLAVKGDSWQLVQEQGKNLIDIKEFTSTLYNNTISDKDTLKSAKRIPRNTKLYLRGKCGESSITQIYFIDSDGNILGKGYVNSNGFTISDGEISMVRLYGGTSSGGEERTFKDIMISTEYGLDYEPFQPAMPSPEYPSEIKDVGGKMVSTNNCLGGKDKLRGNSITLPTLRGLPDGTRDVLYVDRKAKRAWVERKVGHEVFNGTELWGTSYWSKMCVNQNESRKAVKGTAYSTHFHHTDTINTYADRENAVFAEGQAIGFGYDGDADAFKTFLQNQYANGTPLTAIYALAEPVIEELPYSDYLLDTCQWETNISFVDCDSNLVPKIEVGCKVLGR